MGRVSALTGRKNLSTSLGQPSLYELPSRPADRASLTLVPDRTSSESQQDLGLLGVAEQYEVMKLTLGEVGHPRPNLLGGEKENAMPLALRFRRALLLGKVEGRRPPPTGRRKERRNREIIRPADIAETCRRRTSPVRAAIA